MNTETEALRTLHARFLERKPGMAELPSQLRNVARICELDADSAACREARDRLTASDRERIDAARMEEHRRWKENAERHALCRRGDEAALRDMFPGHASFYDMVRSPPKFEERAMDAVVVIELGAGSLVRKARAVLQSGMAREALKVQYGGSPNKHASRFNGENFFMGYYTADIEARLAAPRADCERLRHTRFHQAACRRDITLSIVRDWLEARGHKSARFLVTAQSAWPHYQLLTDRLLPDFDTCIDTNFDSRLTSKASFLRHMCTLQRGPGIWIDYEFYVRSLLPECLPDPD